MELLCGEPVTKIDALIQARIELDAIILAHLDKYQKYYSWNDINLQDLTINIYNEDILLSCDYFGDREEYKISIKHLQDDKILDAEIQIKKEQDEIRKENHDKANAFAEKLEYERLKAIYEGGE